MNSLSYEFTHAYSFGHADHACRCILNVLIAFLNAQVRSAQEIIFKKKKRNHVPKNLRYKKVIAIKRECART